MKKSNLFLCVLLFNCLFTFSQEPDRIRFSRSFAYSYFFPKGEAGDSVIPVKGREFYYLIPDTLRKKWSILVENGKFSQGPNDSLIMLKYLPGLRYESMYVQGESRSSDQDDSLVFRTFVNGASVIQKHVILIQLMEKRGQKVLLENRYYPQSIKD